MQPLNGTPLSQPPFIRKHLAVNDSGSCTATMAVTTVSYAFITRSVLPLWPLWKHYFHGCNGQAMPIFHVQDIRSHALVRKVSASFGGLLLSPAETIQGNPRFSWKMVAIMMRLYHAAIAARAPNGCTPRWVITFSERCAPVQKCSVVHSSLAAHPAVNRIETPFRSVPYEKSQWTALWLADAAEVAANEAALEAFWQPRIRDRGYTVILPPTRQTNHVEVSTSSAPDEVIIPFEILERRLPIMNKGPTYVCWHCFSLGGVPTDGHVTWTSPSGFVTYTGALNVCRRAQREGYFFVRKIGDGSPTVSRNVMQAMVSPLCLNLSNATFGGQLASRPLWNYDHMKQPQPPPLHVHGLPPPKHMHGFPPPKHMPKLSPPKQVHMMSSSSSHMPLHHNVHTLPFRGQHPGALPPRNILRRPPRSARST